MKKLIIFFLLAPLFSIANKIYVGASGSNISGNGTIGNPYATLTHAVPLASSGDTIFILPGVITEPATVVIPTGINLDAADTTAIIRSSEVDDFEPIIQMHSPQGTAGNQFIRNIKFDGQNLATSWGIDIRGRSNTKIYNCVFRNLREAAITWSAQQGWGTSPPSIFDTGNSIYNNIIHNCASANSTYGKGCIQFGGQDGMQIYNNFIKNDYRAAGLNGWPIKGFNDSWIKNCRIHHNELISAPFPYVSNGANNYWNFAVELFDNLGGNEIDSNIITGSIDINRQQKGSAAYSVYIHHNLIGFATMQANPQSGIILEYSTPDAIISNNTIRNVADGIIFSTRNNSAITNTVIKNNQLYNLGSTLGGYGDGVGVHDDGSNNYTVNGLFIYNNTVKCTASGSQASVYGINFSSARTITNWRVRNNIVIGFQEACLWSNVTDSISSSLFTNNFFYGNVRNTPFTNWQGTRTLPVGNTLATNTLGVDPELLTISDTLSATSPCIDAGVDVGLPFNDAAPDIGYRESGGAVNIPPAVTASATPGVITLPSNSVLLQSTASDADGTISTYTWVKQSGPSSFSFTSQYSSTTSVTGLVSGTYVFRITVVDNNSASSYYDVSVVVNAAVVIIEPVIKLRGKKFKKSN